MPNILHKRANKLLCCLGTLSIITLGLFGIPALGQAADVQYDLTINLSGGETAAIQELESKLGLEGEGWQWWWGDFTPEGFRLSERSSLMLNLGDNFPVEYVNVTFEASGIDNDVESLTGNKDGYMFNLWSTDPGWKDPCNADGSVNTENAANNWGFGIKKWPSMPTGDGSFHMYSNSILAQGVGMSNGTGVPGAGIGDRFDWEEQAGFYTINLSLHGGQAESSLLTVERPNGTGVLNSPGGVPYGPLSLDDRSSVVASIGAESEWNQGPCASCPSYGGVTIRNVRIQAGTEPIPSDRQVWLPECEEGETGDDIDDPNNPYDTCSCHAIPDVTAPRPCEDKLDRNGPRKVSFLAPFPFDFDGLRIKWKWKMNDIIKEGNSKNEQMAVMPEAHIEFSPPSPETGSEGGAIATTMNFRTKMKNMYYGWCMVDDDTVYPFNSIVAGGKELPELSDPGISWSDGGCCQPITRIPDAGDDTDNDGMADSWERLMFIERGDFGYTDITQINPGDDPDSDGYYANTFENQDGELLTVTPYLIDAFGNRYATGTADASLTNIEEYILDTDPLNGDTDSDGYADEMDFIGVGQMQVLFPVDKASGPEGFYDFSVAIAGMNEIKKTSLVSTKRRLFVGGGGLLKVNLDSDKRIITFDDSQSLTISTSLLAGNANTEDLAYEWFFNGESVCDGVEPDWPQLCDIGQREVSFGGEGISYFDLPQPVSQQYTFKVKVISPESRNEAQAEITLPIALPTSLVTDGCSGQTQDISTLTANEKVPVIVCISEIDEIEKSRDLQALNFVWYKDGAEDNEQSGLGKSSYALISTKPAGESHEVEVAVKDVGTAQEILNSSRSFEIVGPSIEIIEPETTSYDPETADKYRFATVNPGDEVSLKARMDHFVGDGGYEINWLPGNQEEVSYETDDKEAVYIFSVPETARDGDTFDVSVQVSSPSQAGLQQASDSIILVVGQPPVEIGAAGKFFGNLAAVFTKIPEIFRSLLVYASIFALVFFGLVYLYPKFSRYISRDND